MKIFSDRRIRSLLMVFLVVIAVFGNGCEDIVEEGAEHLLKRVLERQDFGEIVRLSDDKKRVISFVGKGKKAFQGIPSGMASQFLKENRDLFGLKADDLTDLRVLNENARPFGANVEFQQIWKGLPVENGRIQINFDQQGHVVQVVNSYTPTTDDLDQTSIPKEQAVETAINEFLRITPDNPSDSEEQETKTEQPQNNPAGNTVSRDQLRLKEDPKVDDVFVDRNGRLHRAYRISINALLPFGSKQFVTDANSGEILHTRNFVPTSVDGQGEVFMPNPVNSQNKTDLGDRRDSDEAVSTNNPNPYFTVQLLGLEASTQPFQLRGPFVVLEDIEPPENTPPEKSDPNGFSFKRNADEFEEVMIYFHIDRMQRYIQELGFMNVMNRRLSVDAHGVDKEDNCHYFATPETLGKGYLAFGDGGTDGAEDGDVIAHEYGHAIQDNQAPGKYSGVGEPLAMGEGFGDYWAFSSFFDDTITNDYIVNGHDDRCLMEWDAVIKGCRRRIDEGPPATSFNSNLDPHQNGAIWSQTLFEIFKKLGKKTTDRLIIQSHFNISGGTFRAGADAIIAANLQLFSAQPNVIASNKAKLCEVFIQREIFNAKCS